LNLFDGIKENNKKKNNNYNKENIKNTEKEYELFYFV